MGVVPLYAHALSPAGEHTHHALWPLRDCIKTPKLGKWGWTIPSRVSDRATDTFGPRGVARSLLTPTEVRLGWLGTSVCSTVPPSSTYRELIHHSEYNFHVFHIRESDVPTHERR